MKTVTLADTGTVARLMTESSVRPQPSPCGDGWGWIDATDQENDFRIVPLWGREGWDLGSWPYIVFATAEHPLLDGTGHAYGYATYVEGDLDAHWYSSADARDLAISKEAWWYWCSGQAECPEALRGKDPDAFEPIDGFCEPYLGFGC